MHADVASSDRRFEVVDHYGIPVAVAPENLLERNIEQSANKSVSQSVGPLFRKILRLCRQGRQYE